MPYLNRCFGEVWGQCFWNEYHILWYFSGYLGYLVLAHYIHVHLTWNRSKRLVIGIASMVVGALLTIYSFYVQAIPGVTLVTPEIEIGWAFCTINYGGYVPRFYLHRQFEISTTHNRDV